MPESRKHNLLNVAQRQKSDVIEQGVADPTRRSLLSWMGNASVFALSSNFLMACTEQIESKRVTSVPPDTTLGAYAFPFQPTEDDDEIYAQWWGNTVDYQNLADILASWQLNVNGLVAEPMTLSFADLMSLSRQDQVTDFHCVEGWSVLDVPWNGVHISRLIDLVRPTSEATHITFRSFRGIYSESLPLEVALESRTLLAYGIGGGTLPLTHGFPLRVIVPRMYGYKSAKWIDTIEFTNTELEGYWEQRGYPSDAPVKASRLREGKY